MTTDSIVSTVDNAGPATAPPISKEAERRGGEVGPRPQSFGFDVQRLNQEFALVLMGSKAVVFLEQPAAPLEDQKRVLTIEAFSAWLANRTTQVAASDGKIRSVTWAKAWLQSPSRRSYRGIEFHPDANNNPGTEGYLNLWSGFAVKPAANVDPKRYGTFRDHLLVNVCRGDDRVFNWVFGFFAHVVQRPRERLGAAFVLRGRMGSGKTKVGDFADQERLPLRPGPTLRQGLATCHPLQ